MAAGYNLKQTQEYLGHADLVTTGRYIKNLPVPKARRRERSSRPTWRPRSAICSPRMWTRIWTQTVRSVAVCRGSWGTRTAKRDLDGMPARRGIGIDSNDAGDVAHLGDIPWGCGRLSIGLPPFCLRNRAQLRDVASDWPLSARGNHPHWRRRLE
jgi:hypothetical protein